MKKSLLQTVLESLNKKVSSIDSSGKPCLSIMSECVIDSMALGVSVAEEASKLDYSMDDLKKELLDGRFIYSNNKYIIYWPEIVFIDNELKNE